MLNNPSGSAPRLKTAFIIILFLSQEKIHGIFGLFVFCKQFDTLKLVPVGFVLQNTVVAARLIQTLLKAINRFQHVHCVSKEQPLTTCWQHCATHFEQMRDCSLEDGKLDRRAAVGIAEKAIELLLIQQLNHEQRGQCLRSLGACIAKEQR